LGDRNGLTVDDEVEKGHPAIFHLPADGAPSSEKRVQGVFDLDFALVAGIINYVLANAATTDISMSGCLAAGVSDKAGKRIGTLFKGHLPS
jgi:hypothetical protein